MDQGALKGVIASWEGWQARRFSTERAPAPALAHKRSNLRAHSEFGYDQSYAFD
jgi:hypothetical protein